MGGIRSDLSLAWSYTFDEKPVIPVDLGFEDQTHMSLPARVTPIIHHEYVYRITSFFLSIVGYFWKQPRPSLLTLKDQSISVPRQHGEKRLLWEGQFNTFTALLKIDDVATLKKLGSYHSFGAALLKADATFYNKEGSIPFVSTLPEIKSLDKALQSIIPDCFNLSRRSSTSTAGVTWKKEEQNLSFSFQNGINPSEILADENHLWFVDCKNKANFYFNLERCSFKIDPKSMTIDKESRKITFALKERC